MKLRANDVRKAVREYYPTASVIEVGLRAGTFDSRAWTEDDDLDDIRQLREVDAKPGMVLDLYVYDYTARARAEGHEGLLGNLDLIVSDDGASFRVIDPVEVSVRIVLPREGGAS